MAHPLTRKGRLIPARSAADRKNTDEALLRAVLNLLDRLEEVLRIAGRLSPAIRGQ
jgi:hypothetical protein